MPRESVRSSRSPGPGGSLADRLLALAAWFAATTVTAILVWILVDILVRGYSQLSWAFLVEPVEDAGRRGGIGPIAVSTLGILAVSLAVAVPISVAAAVALYESPPSRWLRAIRRCLDILASVPSIVFGLFGNAVFCIALAMGYSILAGGLTLACMILPILTRTTEQALRQVPDAYRLAAAGLGLNRTSTLWRVILPTAAPSMAAGLVLSIGRVLAETAALIFTAGYVTRTPHSLWDSGRALSVHIYDLAMNVPGGNSRAYATATVLVLILLVINFTANALTRLVGLQSAGEWEDR